MDDVLGIWAFLPAKDFEVSKRFYQSLGFKLTFEDTGIAGFKWGSFSFILKDFYVKEYAENSMMQMLVRDADKWWRETDPVKLAAEFGLWAPKPPAIQPWGMKVGFFADPSGVLWHVAEVPF